MTTYKTIALAFPEAQDLADLDGVYRDLEWIRLLCTKIIRAERSRRRNSQRLEALTSAALIRYGRCFHHGVRRRLPQSWVDHLPDPFPRAHRYFMDLRDKFFAHSVNRFEINHATAAVPEPAPADYRIEDIGFFHQHLSSLGEPDILVLKQLCTALQGRVKAAIVTEKSAVLAIARTIAPSKLNKTDLISAENIKLRDVGRPRKTARKGRAR